MIDMRAIHDANHGQYDRFSYAADTLSNDYLKSRGAHMDKAKYRAWYNQQRTASVKSPSAPAGASSGSPSPAAKSPAPKDGRRFTSASPSQDGPVNFSRQAGSYDKAGSGGVDLSGFDRPRIFAGKGTAQPSVSRADVPSNGRGAHAAGVAAVQMAAVRSSAGQADTHSDFRQLPAVQRRSPGAGGPQPRGGEPTGHQEQLFHALPSPSPRPSASPAAPEGWSARTGASMVARSIEMRSASAAGRPTPAPTPVSPSPSAPRPVSAPPSAPAPGWTNRAGNSLVQKSQGIAAKRAEFKTAATSHTNGNGQTRLF